MYICMYMYINIHKYYIYIYIINIYIYIYIYIYGKCEKLGNMYFFRPLCIILKIGLFIRDFE